MTDDYSRDPSVPQVEPPRPRKLPQQSRSRMLVDSVKEACLKILKDKGPRALTATEIAEVSGVAMGSIYQYFPNVDAIVATVYEALIEDDIRIAQARQTELRHGLGLEDSMRAVIRGTLSFHRRMLRLDQEFHQRFYQTFDLQNWFNRVNDDPHASRNAIYDILIAHKEEVALRNPEMEAFVITACLQATVLDAVKYHPEYFESADFADYLHRIWRGVLTPLPSKPADAPSAPSDV